MIKNPKRLYEKYLIQFKDCFGNPLTESEIVQKANMIDKEDKKESKEEKEKKKPEMTKPLFEQKYLPKLRELALITTIIKNEKQNKEALNKFYNEWKSNVRGHYFFFTPKTAEINLIFLTIMNKFQEYLEDEDKIIDKLNHLITQLAKYELLFNVKQPISTFEKIEKISEILEKGGNKKDIEAYIKTTKSPLDLTRKEADESIKKLKKSKRKLLSEKERLEYTGFKNKIFNFLLFGGRDEKPEHLIVSTPKLFESMEYIKSEMYALLRLLEKNINLESIMETESKKLR